MVEGEALHAICEHLEAVAAGNIHRILMNVSPGFMKSLLTNVFFPAFIWGPLDRASARFVTFSYAAHLTERDNERFRNLVRSREYQDLWGHRVVLTGEGKIKVTNAATGWKFASSIGGVGTGERGDFVILDDPHNVKESESDAVRQETVRWFCEAMQNRLNDMSTGSIIVIMQRVHEKDVSGTIIEEFPEYEHLCIPMEYEPELHCKTSIGWEDWRTEAGELAWPERFPLAQLLPFKRRPFLWAGQYQQRPEPRGGGILKRDWWMLWDDECGAFHGYEKNKFPTLDYIICGLDTAYTEKEENDPSACEVWGIWTDRNSHKRAILMFAWSEHLEFNALVIKVADTCKKWKVDRLLIEAKASGLSVAQEIRRLHSQEDWTVQTLDPGRGDKIARAYQVQPMFERSMIYAPDKSWADAVISQIATFPKGAHDDYVDVATMVLSWFRKTGLLVMDAEAQFDEREAMVHRSGNITPLYPA
jgi:predicted phage terminase large subunit-like protein